MKKQNNELIKGIGLKKIAEELTNVALGNFRTEYEVYRAVHALKRIEKYCESVQTEENKEIQNLVENSLIIIRRNRSFSNCGVFWPEIFNVQVKNVPVADIYEESVKELFLLTTPMYGYVFRKTYPNSINNFLKYFDRFQFEFMEEEIKEKWREYRIVKQDIEIIKNFIVMLKEDRLPDIEKLNKIASTIEKQMTIIEKGLSNILKEHTELIKEFEPIGKEENVSLEEFIKKESPEKVENLQKLIKTTKKLEQMAEGLKGLEAHVDEIIPELHKNMMICVLLAEPKKKKKKKKKEKNKVEKSSAEEDERRIFSDWVFNELNILKELSNIVRISRYISEFLQNIVDSHMAEVEKPLTPDLFIARQEELKKKADTLLKELKKRTHLKTESLIRKEILKSTLETRFDEIVKKNPKMGSAFLSIVQGYEDECAKDHAGNVKIEEVFRLTMKHQEVRARFFRFQHLAFCAVKDIPETDLLL